MFLLRILFLEVARSSSRPCALASVKQRDEWDVMAAQAA
jgi:hypothetical protein